VLPELYPHQAEAVSKMHNGCILKGGVGSGKSRTALAYFSDNENVEELYIITTGMKRDTEDWKAEARLFGIFAVVDSWHNIAKYADVEGAFFIFDEQRLVGSGSWVQAFLRIAKQNQWIMLSATPGDSWMDYIPVFIANGFYKNRTEFLREHVIFSRFAKYPKVENYTSVSRLERQLRAILVEMPFEKHTTRILTDVFCEYDRDLYETVWKRRWNFAEDRPIRQVSEMFMLLRRVVNSHPSRLEKVRDLLVTHPRMIIFYNFDYELEMLRGLEIEKAEWNGHKHEPVPDGDEWVYLVQFTAGAEGWNCTKTDSVLIFSTNYSYRAFEQAQGRIDRLDTPFEKLYYYILRSSAPIDTAIVLAIASKKDFNETAFLRSAGRTG
jgi:hypothetical protein